MTALLLAQESAGVLLRSFVIALLLVTPVAAWQWRRIRARRAEAEARNDPVAEAVPTADAADPRALETVITTIAELAASTEPGATTSLQVPAGVTLEGRPTSASMVERIVADALSRDGLEVVARTRTAVGGAGETDMGWTFECRKQ